MDEISEEKQRILMQTLETTIQSLDDLDPTTLIDIDFYKSYGLWDDEVSKKYDEVVKKWEKIKEITHKETKHLNQPPLHE